nr:MAG TPA: hypothetical protein [Caudoviricetes sp.]DAX21821.1 MAG TPA: hypothetical protein [Caudoviricetes sp.]
MRLKKNVRLKILFYIFITIVERLRGVTSPSLS